MCTARPDSGFTLVELLVAMALIALVLGGAVTMFNYTNELARAQLHQSDLQQSGRVAQREMLANLRMAGRGGLPGYHLHGFDANSGPASDTPAISVTSNVILGTRIVPGDATSPRVQLGTDILTVRGHFNSPPLYVASTDPTTFNPNPGSGGTVVISSHIAGEVMQDMTAIIDAVNANRADAVPLVRVDPEYPPRARQRGIEGYVDLTFTIGPTGSVQQASVLGANPVGVFEEAALRAVKRWRYNPKVENGVPVARPGVKVRLRFTLPKG